MVRNRQPDRLPARPFGMQEGETTDSLHLGQLVYNSGNDAG